MRIDLQIHKPFTGLFNQICALIYGIYNAKINNKKIVVVKTFLKEIKKPNMTTAISNIINIEETNKLLYKKIGVILLDANNIDLKIQKVNYKDIENKVCIDITEQVKKNYYKQKNILYIPKNSDFKQFYTKKKISDIQKLEINILINGYDFKMEYNLNQGYNKHNIIIDYENFDFKFMFQYPNKDVEDFYESCFECLIFGKDYYVNIGEKIGKNYDKINLCHLRVEIDGLQHWSKMNEISLTDFKKKIENIYIYYIKKYFEKNSLNIILTYSTQNPVIDFLKKNNYDYFILNKDYEEGREINALRDFLLGKYCNNVFIGAEGSSFSWGLKLISNPNIQVFIDLNHITSSRVLNVESKKNIKDGNIPIFLNKSLHENNIQKNFNDNIIENNIIKDIKNYDRDIINEENTNKNKDDKIIDLNEKDLKKEFNEDYELDLNISKNYENKILNNIIIKNIEEAKIYTKINTNQNLYLNENSNTNQNLNENSNTNQKLNENHDININKIQNLNTKIENINRIEHNNLDTIDKYKIINNQNKINMIDKLNKSNLLNIPNLFKVSAINKQKIKKQQIINQKNNKKILMINKQININFNKIKIMKKMKFMKMNKRRNFI